MGFALLCPSYTLQKLLFRLHPPEILSKASSDPCDHFSITKTLDHPFYLNFSFVLTLGTFYFLNWPPLLKVLYCNVIKPPTSIYQTSILDLFFFPQLSLSWVISLIATSMSFQVNPKAPSLFLPFSQTPSLFLT